MVSILTNVNGNLYLLMRAPNGSLSWVDTNAIYSFILHGYSTVHVHTAEDYENTVGEWWGNIEDRETWKPFHKGAFGA